MRLTPNKRLREERRRRGWTQVDVVKRMYQAATNHRLPIPEGLDNTYISKYERGQNRPSPHHVHLLCLAFDLPSDRLGLPGNAEPPSVPVGPGSSVPAPATAVPYVDGRSVVLYVGSGDDDFVNLTLNRHEFLGAVGGSMVQPLQIPLGDDDLNRRAFLRCLGVAATNIALPPTEPDRSNDRSRSDDLGVFPYQPPQPEDMHLDRFVHINATLWAAFVAAGSKLTVLPAVRDQIRVLTDSLQRSRSVDQHRQLCATAGALFQLAGEIYFDANHYADAIQCYAIAIDACKEANAHDLWACAITRQAYVAIYEHKFADSLPLLSAADRVTRHGDGTLPTRHWVHAVAAEAFAGAGDLMSCQRALDQAETVHALNRPVGNGGWLRFDGSRLAEQRGACFTKLGRPELAEPALREALTLNLSARRRGLVLADLSLVALQRYEIEQACAHGAAAMEIARLSASGVIKRRLVDLRQRLTPFAHVSSVKQYIDEMASL